MPDETGTRSLSGCPFPHEMNRILFESGEIRDGRATFSDVRAEHVLNVLHGEVGQTLKTGVVDGKTLVAVYYDHGAVDMVR